MGGYESYDPFSVCFNILKLRYKDYDESLTSMDFLKPYDKINVFINLETVYKNLSMVMDLEKKILLQRDFDTLMISNIINLVSHYKRFFVGNGLDTKVYLYNTDFKSEEFNQFKYNDNFRSYYLVKFNNNPKFISFTEHLTESILPDVKVYCEFIPNVYYISAKNIEGSLVPYIIAEADKTRKNLIIGGELFDTQYSFIPNFVNHYIHRGFNSNAVHSDINGYIKDICKNQENVVTDEESKLYKNHAIYSSLISVLGDQSRSIDGIHGYGFKTFDKCISDALSRRIITEKTTSPDIIGDIFASNKTKEEFINNFYCSNILPMYEELTQSEISSILTQIIDRSDINTLQQLNATKFYNHPLILEGLLI